MVQPPQGPSGQGWQNHTSLDVGFKEYQLLSESTDKLSDRRQMVNTLFVTVNALFLTGVGYLLLQFLKHIMNVGSYLAGFLVIAIIMTIINGAWLKLSDSYSKLVNLRIRYMEQLEQHLHDGGHFPYVEIKLQDYEIGSNEADTLTSRGTYTIEEVLYSPGVKKLPFGFSRAERRFNITLTRAYWGALAFAILAYVLMAVLPSYGMGIPHFLPGF